MIVQHIQTLVDTPGVFTALVASDLDGSERYLAREYRGAEQDYPLLDTAIAFYLLAKKSGFASSNIRCRLDKHCVLVHQEGAEIACLVLEKGHPVNKSILRTIGRMGGQKKKKALPKSEAILRPIVDALVELPR